MPWCWAVAGSRARFKLGVLSVILADKDYAPAGIFGSSTGALNGAFLADRAGRQSLTGTVDWAAIGQELTQFWRETVTAPDDLWKPRDLDFSTSGLENIQKVLEGKGFLDTEPLKNIIAREANQINLRAAKLFGISYYPATVDLVSGNIHYPDASDPNIDSFILASAALPSLMPYVDVTSGTTHGGLTYGRFVDGGMRDVAPLQRAVSLGYTKITCSLPDRKS